MRDDSCGALQWDAGVETAGAEHTWTCRHPQRKTPGECAYLPHEAKQKLGTGDARRHWSRSEAWWRKQGYWAKVLRRSNPRTPDHLPLSLLPEEPVQVVELPCQEVNQVVSKLMDTRYKRRSSEARN